MRGYNFTFVKRLVLVQIIKLSPFKTQNIIIKQTWFSNLYHNEPLYKSKVILSHCELDVR